MKIQHSILFEHAFLLESVGGRDNGKRIDFINNWCGQNCEGRWLLIDGSSYSGSTSLSVSYYSKAFHESPIDEKYPPASIKIRCQKIISFEESSDALAFKLYFENNTLKDEP